MGYILDKIIMIPMVLIALMFHELAHGFVSIKLGDPTPKYQGRMTLNPLAHLDPVGALLMVLTGFGWAKPVQINPRYYKNPKKGMALTALAGPLTNFLLAVIAMFIHGVIIVICVKTGNDINSIDTIGYILSLFIQLNLCFMVFNFIPIPPLDGSRILGLFLSNRAYFKLQEYERYSFIILIALSVSGAFDRIIGTGVVFVYNGMANALIRLIELVI